MTQSGNQRKQYKQIRFGFKYTLTEGRENEIPNTELLMDLYEKLITANEHLTDAIKWQDPDRLSTQYWDHMSSMCYALGSVLALACPCACADRLQRRVNDLRMMLATRIYEDKLDERSRVSARALLALTGAHGLGVSLLGMLRVDISLPLHYVSLLVTYLIILLQFEKVNSKV
ncbi:unnamed protein product [Plutella xylostella]|uniref:(diamondback moth) hypothetical protein n=1 Tax=Plutella xylostella TaxID=51655 RepID=A0A8S4E808_PLUXY|nr:unnamed protein product [Plutella xylostella]